MAVNESRSLKGSLHEGATDGKYRKARPHTTVAEGMGEQIVDANRKDLWPYWNYGYPMTETAEKVDPLSTDAPRKMSSGQDKIFDREMGANY